MDHRAEGLIGRAKDLVGFCRHNGWRLIVYLRLNIWTVLPGTFAIAVFILLRQSIFLAEACPAGVNLHANPIFCQHENLVATTLAAPLREIYTAIADPALNRSAQIAAHALSDRADEMKQRKVVADAVAGLAQAVQDNTPAPPHATAGRSPPPPAAVPTPQQLVAQHKIEQAQAALDTANADLANLLTKAEAHDQFRAHAALFREAKARLRWVASYVSVLIFALGSIVAGVWIILASIDDHLFPEPSPAATPAAPPPPSPAPAPPRPPHGTSTVLVRVHAEVRPSHPGRHRPLPRPVIRPPASPPPQPVAAGPVGAPPVNRAGPLGVFAGWCLLTALSAAFFQFAFVRIYETSRTSLFGNLPPSKPDSWRLLGFHDAMTSFIFGDGHHEPGQLLPAARPLLAHADFLILLAFVALACAASATLYQRPFQILPLENSVDPTIIEDALKDDKPKSLPQQPYDRLLIRCFQRLNMCVYVGATLLVVCVVNVSARYCWAAALLDPAATDEPWKSSLPDSINGLAEELALQYGLGFTTLLLALFLPVFIILRRRAWVVARLRNPGSDDAKKLQDWLSDNGMAFTVVQKYAQILAVLAPAGAGFFVTALKAMAG